MSETHRCEMRIPSQAGMTCAGIATGRIVHEGKELYACDPCIASLTGAQFCFVHGKVHVHLGRGHPACPDCVREADAPLQQMA